MSHPDWTEPTLDSLAPSGLLTGRRNRTNETQAGYDR